MGVFEQSFLYDHDNSTPHIICDTAAFLAEQDMEVMDWTAQSTDMYPIKHVWDEIGVWIRYLDDPPCTVIAACCVLHAWAVVAARGGHTIH